MPEPPSPSASLPFSFRFRLGPFPVVVEPTFWLVALLGVEIGPLRMAVWAAVSFASILVHELGHALAARRYGSSAWIRLYGLGGLTYHAQLPEAGQRILVSLAGPGAGFLLGLLALAVRFQLPLSAPPLAWTAVTSLLWVSFVWGLVNLLPVPPLDGGHVFEEAVGPHGQLLAAQVGTIIGAAATLEGVHRLGLLAGVMFGFLTTRCFATWMRLAAERRIQRQLTHLRERMWEEALALDEVGVAHRGALRETMRELHETAHQLPPQPEPDQDRDPALLARVFEELGVPGRAADHAVDAYRRDPSDQSALQAVRLLVAAGRRPEAEALWTRARWSSEAARAEASSLLQRPTPTRSRH